VIVVEDRPSANENTMPRRVGLLSEAHRRFFESLLPRPRSNPDGDQRFSASLLTARLDR
jgi:hypothetical protein